MAITVSYVTVDESGGSIVSAANSSFVIKNSSKATAYLSHSSVYFGFVAGYELLPGESFSFSTYVGNTDTLYGWTLHGNATIQIITSS